MGTVIGNAGEGEYDRAERKEEEEWGGRRGTGNQRWEEKKGSRRGKGGQTEGKKRRWEVGGE